MSLPAEKQATLRATLGPIDDPQERLGVATAWKHGLEPLPPEARVDGNLVRGCVSRVWLTTAWEAGHCRIRMDAESALVRGLAGLICWIYDGATREEIIAEEPVALEELGIVRNLSPTRRNGLAAVRRMLLEWALRSRMRFFDAHNHLQDPALAPRLPEVLDTLEKLGVAGAW